MLQQQRQKNHNEFALDIPREMAPKPERQPGTLESASLRKPQAEKGHLQTGELMPGDGKTGP